MEVFFACSLVLPRWEQFGYQKHATLEAARTEARAIVDNRAASSVKIVKIEETGAGPTFQYNHTVVEEVS